MALQATKMRILDSDRNDVQVRDELEAPYVFLCQAKAELPGSDTDGKIPQTNGVAVCLAAVVKNRSCQTKKPDTREDVRFEKIHVFDYCRVTEITAACVMPLAVPSISTVVWPVISCAIAGEVALESCESPQ